MSKNNDTLGLVGMSSNQTTDTCVCNYFLPIDDPWASIGRYPPLACYSRIASSNKTVRSRTILAKTNSVLESLYHYLDGLHMPDDAFVSDSRFTNIRSIDNRSLGSIIHWLGTHPCPSGDIHHRLGWRHPHTILTCS